MRRRDFVIVLLGSTLLATREGRTQQQRLLGFLSAGSADAYAPFIDAFRSALSDAAIRRAATWQSSSAGRRVIMIGCPN